MSCDFGMYMLNDGYFGGGGGGVSWTVFSVGLEGLYYSIILRLEVVLINAAAPAPGQLVM